MSKHFSAKRTIVVNKLEEGTFEKSGRYKELSRKEIYCKCGYKGSGVIEYKKGYLPKERGTKRVEKDETKEYEVNEVCPICKRKGDLHINAGGKEASIKTDFTKIWEREDKVSFHICYSSYYYNKKVEKIGVKKNRFVLTCNLNNGFIYMINNKSIVNWTYASDRFKMEKRANEIMELIRDKETFRDFKKFLKLCLEKRGVKYYNYNKKIGQTSSGERFRMSDLRTLFALIRYPVLQDMPSEKNIVNFSIPKKARKKIAKAEKIDQAYKEIFGLKTKKSVRVFKESDNHPIVSIFSNLMNEESSVDYFIDLFEEKKKKDEINLRDFYRYEMNDFESTIINSANTVHLSNFKKHYDDFNSPQMLYMGLKHIKSFYKKEKTFIRRLFNTKEKIKVKKTKKIKKYKLNISFVRKRVLNLREILHLLEDTYKMQQMIMEAAPELEVKYSDDILHYHDLLSKTVSRIKIKNKIINYNKEEEEYYKEHIDEYEIKLARDTHEIIESGTKMQICVPSYANAAVKKELYIMFVYKGLTPVACLELRITDQTVDVIQVKANENQLIEKKLAEIMAKYFNEKKLRFADCWDMKYFEGIEEPKIKGKNKKELPKVAKMDVRKKEIEIKK